MGDLITITLPYVSPGTYELEFGRAIDVIGTSGASADVMSDAIDAQVVQPITIVP